MGTEIGRYVLGPEIASGGMASVYLGRMRGPAGFGKTVALKRLHTNYVRDPEFVKMFHDEARLTSALSHPNIVMTLDVLAEEAEADSLYLVMEYVHGASLTQINRRLSDQKPVPLPITAGIIAAMLDGLHAAHEAADENGTHLGVVHRDVSPQNVLVSFQGIAKIADFGIAKAAGRAANTSDGSAKGKISYMAPEQVLGTPITAKTDVYAAGIVLWEALTGKRLIDGSSAAENVRSVLQLVIDPPSSLVPEVSVALDKVVLRAVERDPVNRFRDAKEMATELRKATECAHASEIGDWVRAERPHLLEARERNMAELQRTIGATSVGQLKPASSASSSSSSTPHVASIDPVSSPSVESAASAAAAGLPHKPKWLFGAVALFFAFAIAGLVLVLIATRHTPASSPPPSSPETKIVVSAPPAPSTAALTSATSDSTTIDLDEVNSPPIPTPSTSPSPSTTAKPPQLTAKRKCRIVTSIDSAGHTKFTEVCQ